MNYENDILKLPICPTPSAMKKELLPIQIWNFDPVKRQLIQKKDIESYNKILCDNNVPKFFDLSLI